MKYLLLLACLPFAAQTGARGGLSRFSQLWPWGALYQDMIPTIRQVLSSGRRVAVVKRPRRVAVLAPVYDSRGDIVGLVDAVTQQPVDPLGNVK